MSNALFCHYFCIQQLSNIKNFGPRNNTAKTVLGILFYPALRCRTYRAIKGFIPTGLLLLFKMEMCRLYYTRYRVLQQINKKPMITNPVIIHQTRCCPSMTSGDISPIGTKLPQKYGCAHISSSCPDKYSCLAN